jgi:hypothetical protein
MPISPSQRRYANRRQHVLAVIEAGGPTGAAATILALEHGITSTMLQELVRGGLVEVRQVPIRAGGKVTTTRVVLTATGRKALAA